MKKLISLFWVILVCFSVISCSSKSKKSDNKIEEKADKNIIDQDSDDFEETNLKAQKLYDEGIKFLEKRRYGMAVETLDKIERDYPYSKLSAKAQVLIAFIDFVKKDYEDVIKKVDAFTKLNPVNPNTPYMNYLKAISYYYMTTTPDKDQAISKEAYLALQNVMARFTGTDYSADAKEKLDIVVNKMIIHEMEIGKMYLVNKNYLAATKRFSTVIRDYPDSDKFHPEAYYRLVESYLFLGLIDEALKTHKNMEELFSDSIWTRDADILIDKVKTKKTHKD